MTSRVFKWLRQITGVTVLGTLALVVVLGSTTSAVAKPAAGAPVKLSVVSLVNDPAFSWPGVFAGAEAAALAINASGGLGLGHQPVKIVTCDYQLDPNKDNLCAHQLVSSGVAADIGAADAFTPATTPIFQTAGIPRIGLIPFNPSDATASDEYPLQGGGDVALVGTGPILAHLGIHRVAWLEPSPNIPTNAALLQRGFTAAGVTLLGTVLLPNSGVSDYTPYAQQIKNLVAQGAQAVVTNVSAPFFQVWTALKQLGGDTTFVQLASQVDSIQIKKAGAIANGMLDVVDLPPVSATQLPAVRAWRAQMAALAKTGAAGANQFNGQAFNSWLAVYALRGLLAAAKGPITSKMIDALLKTKANIDVQGLLRWSPEAQGPPGFSSIDNGYLWVTKVVNGQEVLTTKTPFNVYKVIFH